MSFDWSDGAYEHTASALLPAVRVLIDAAAPRPGEEALDLGCGTGSAALALVERGARVTAIDPAPRLLEVAASRLGDRARVLRGTAEEIPAPDQSFDLIVSSFAVIFAANPSAAAREITRVLRRGGRALLSTWLPSGPIFAASQAAMAVMAADREVPADLPRWGDPSWLTALFKPFGAQVSTWRHTMAFEAPSPRAWLDEQVQHHPGWRAMQRQLSARPGAWEQAEAAALHALSAGHDPDAGHLTSPYLVARVDFDREVVDHVEPRADR